MLLIITGPQGSGKSTIARSLAKLAKEAVVYDEIPESMPDDFYLQSYLLVIMTTNSAIPEWVKEYQYSELKTNLNDIQRQMESLPLPRNQGPQFTIHQSRHYPTDSPNRFVVRVLKKNFTGNDISDLLIQAKAYYAKKYRK